MAEIRTEVELETACSLLENEHRRGVLRALDDRPGPMARDELARTLAQTAGQREAVERIEGSLYHLHLPKLSDEGAVRYDADAATVAMTEAGTRLLRCLDALERRLGGR